MTYCGIKYEQIKNCGDQLLKYVICASSHKVKEHCYKVVRCNKKKEKICVYVTTKCANCRGTHTTNSLRYVSKYEANIKTKKEKMIKKKW